MGQKYKKYAFYCQSFIFTFDLKEEDHHSSKKSLPIPDLDHAFSGLNWSLNVAKKM